MSRQGKVRLAKWYSTYSQKERARVIKETTPLVLARPLKLCNFLDWKNIKLIYKRYASLYFVCGVDAGDNELITLEIIHEFVEVRGGRGLLGLGTRHMVALHIALGSQTCAGPAAGTLLHAWPASAGAIITGRCKRVPKHI